jgi:hypothetical protein
MPGTSKKWTHRSNAASTERAVATCSCPPRPGRHLCGDTAGAHDPASKPRLLAPPVKRVARSRRIAPTTSPEAERALVYRWTPIRRSWRCSTDAAMPAPGDERRCKALIVLPSDSKSVFLRRHGAAWEPAIPTPFRYFPLLAGASVSIGSQHQQRPEAYGGCSLNHLCSASLPHGLGMPCHLGDRSLKWAWVCQDRMSRTSRRRGASPATTWIGHQSLRRR